MEQPEALRIAGVLEGWKDPTDFTPYIILCAVAELRRLYQENELLKEQDEIRERDH